MTRPDIEAIRARVEDCKTYNFGMTNANKLAHVNVPALLAYVEQLEAQIERVRELHKRVHAVGTRTGLRYEDPCPECDGKAGVHECGCWADTDIEFVCAECHRLGGVSVRDYTYPCPTIKALGDDNE